MAVLLKFIISFTHYFISMSTYLWIFVCIIIIKSILIIIMDLQDIIP